MAMAMAIMNRFAAGIAALLMAPMAQAAFVNIDEPGLDAVFRQASFGANPIDIRIAPTVLDVFPALLNVDSANKLTAAFNEVILPGNTVTVLFVDTVDYCGVFDVSIVGCSQRPGKSVVVESAVAADTTQLRPGFPDAMTVGVQLLAHELGHALNLDHSNALSALMYPSITGSGNLSAAEVDTIRASPLVQHDASGYFIQLQPVLVAAAVPEPSSMALMAGGLLLAGAAVRRARPAGRLARTGCREN